MGMSSFARPLHPWLHPRYIQCLPFVAQNNQYAHTYSRNIQLLITRFRDLNE